MKVLVTGGGAREHVLAWRCMQSPLTTRVYCAPGNGGTAGIAQNVPIASDDVVRLVRFCVVEEIDLVILGEDASVAAGVGDALRTEGVLVFGPDRGAGRIESSKVFAAEVMAAAGVPAPESHVFSESGPALDLVRASGRPWVVKADGLARGKGVLVPDSVQATEEAVRRVLEGGIFGSAGSRIVLQERLTGPEVSVFAVASGQEARPLPMACDYKRLLDGDQGPNTGGMGTYSPPGFVGSELAQEVMERAMLPTLRELAARGVPFTGFLYAGVIIDPGGWRVLEFNARFGDPEAQVVLTRVQSDLLPLLLAAARGDMSSAGALEVDSRPAVCVVLASEGYPEQPVAGRPITGLDRLPTGVRAFHAGTAFSPQSGLVTSGGRVLSLVGQADDLASARAIAYSASEAVRFEGSQFRRDIALREVG